MMSATSPQPPQSTTRSGGREWSVRALCGSLLLALSLAWISGCDSRGSASPEVLAGSPEAAPGWNPPNSTPQISKGTSGEEDGALILYRGGTIRIGDLGGSLVEAMVCRGERVLETGSLVALQEKYGAALRANGKEMDLAGATLVPGLHDAHIDVVRLGALLETSLDLRDAQSFEEVCQRVAAAVEGLERGRWLVGHGWEDSAWSQDLCDPAFDATELTLNSPNHPVALWSRDGSRLLANFRALASARLVGPDARRPRPVGGEVVRNLDGDATGVLLDTAALLVAQKIGNSQPTRLRKQILAAQDHLLSLGLTSVQDVGASPETLSVYRELDAAGQLRLRVTVYLDGTGQLEAEDLAGLPVPSTPGSHLAVPGFAYQIDGALATHGAALLEPYADRPRETGRLALETKSLRDKMAQCAQAGLQPALVPVGDRAARMALDVYQELKSAMPGAMALRPRLEEAQVVVPKDWPRFPELGVLASIQPARLAPGLPGASARRSLIERLLGSRRAGGVFAWRRVAPELGVLAFGSDAPAGSANPLHGIFAARRQTEDEAGSERSLAAGGLSGVDALAGYTSGPAYAAHQEAFRGRLLPGYDADFTVLDLDPVRAPLADLLEARVLHVFIGGQRVWSAEASGKVK